MRNTVLTCTRALAFLRNTCAVRKNVHPHYPAPGVDMLIHKPAPACGRSTHALWLGCVLALGISWSQAVVHAAGAAEDRKTLLLLPVASGTPGQELSAKALGGILEDGFGSLRSVRLVMGTAREIALRELSASASITPEGFREICRRAGADFAVLGGSTLVEGRLALEIRLFDVGAALELQKFRGEEPLPRAFNLVEAAIRHVAAAAALGGAESLFPRGATVSLEAYAAYRAALLEEAPAARIEKLREVLKLDADYADPTRRLGVERVRQGTVEEALTVLERAVALGPKLGEARNNFGVALAAAGRAEQAQREFEEAVSLAPDYTEARLNLARVFGDRGRFSDAEKQYAAVLEADAGNDKARSGLAALYDRTGRPELAVKEYRLLSPRRPELAEAEFVRIGQEARKAREYPRAEKFFRRATDINPQFAQGWAELGTNSYLAGEYAKGVEHFRRALTIDPGKAAYHYYLGLALDKGRQTDEALREYRRAVELGGPPEARLGLARAALDSGDPGLAVEELNRLLVASPDHAEAKLLLAQATGEMESRRRLVEGQSQFANQRLARLEQIVADANRANRELEARLQALAQEKRLQEKPAAAASASPADAPARDKTGADDPGREVERLRGELAAERDARKREGAEAQANLALLRTDKERIGRESAAEQERSRREAERLQADLAAAQAKSLELGRGSGESEELRQRLAGLQADQARKQTEFGQERELRLQELARLKTELAAATEARSAENARFKAESAAAEAVRGELAGKAKEAAELKGQLQASQGALAKVEEAQKAERARGEQALLAAREGHRAEVEKLKVEMAPGMLKRQEQERLLQDLAAEKARSAAAQAAREKAEKAQAAEREARNADQEKLKAEAATRIGALEKQLKAQAELLQTREAELAAARVRESSSAAQLARSQAELQLLTERQGALEARAVADARTLAEQERALETGRLAVRDLALELGRSALQAQLWEKAQQFLEQAAAADPRNGEAWYGQGEALFQLGQYEKSKQAYDKAKQIY